MPLIQQNFSMTQGDDTVIMLDIDPDVASLVGSDLTFRVYNQEMGVPLGDPIIVKNLDDGLQIADPEYQLIQITFVPADTINLQPKNYVIECSVWDTNQKRTTVTLGIMTLARAVNPTSPP